MCDTWGAAFYLYRAERPTSNVNMTIPSRPAPPPPQQRITIKLPPPPTSKTKSTSLSNAFGTASSQGRYGSMNAISWDSTSSTTTHSRQLYESIGGRKVPPPRPPPPRVPASSGGNTVLKKPGPPQSVNVLSNLFGKKKGRLHNSSRNVSAIPRVPPLQQQHQHHPPNLLNFGPKKPISSGSSQSAAEAELISFDSPPSSPTLTQKSNSDCVSVDSFSSDSNFSSPNNGSISQPESGFEDDFTTSPVDPWESIIASDSFRGNSPRPSGLNAPVRNLNAINRSQNENPLCNGRSLLPPPTALSMPTIIRPKASQSPIHSGSSRNQYAINALGFSAATLQSSIAPSTFNTSHVKSRASNVFSLEGSSFDDSHDLDNSFPSLPMPSCPPPPPPPANAAASIPSLDLNGAVFPVDDAEEANDGGPSYGIALYDFDSSEEDDLNFKANEKVYILKKLNDEWYLGRNRRGCEGMFPSNYIEIKVPLKDIETDDILASTMVTDETKLSNKIRAIYNFTAEVPEDLTLHENDLVTVLYRINDEWLYGEVNDRRGQFPANFIEYIPKNLSNQMP